MQSIWQLHLNPFFWQGVVFMVWGFLCSVVLSSIWGFPKRLLESL